jgi:transposase-like protein
MLHRWQNQYTPDGDKTKTAVQQDEINKLRYKIAELEEENDDILKKASAFFAKNQK